MAKIKQVQFDEKYLWAGGAILVLIIVIYAMGRVAGKEDDSDPSDANPNIEPIQIQLEEGGVENWNPSSLVKRVHTAFTVNWISGRAAVLKDMSELQDIQLKALAQGYHKVYGTTLRKVLESSWWSGDGLSYTVVIRRFDSLGIV